MARGDLVSDDIVQTIVLKQLDGPDAAKGFILDGFPRTIPQAEALGRRLKKRGRDLDAVIELKADDRLLLDRIAARNANTGSRGELRRVDDDAEVLRPRIDAYHRQTAPVLDYYRGQGLLQSVNGMLSIAQVEQEIDRVLACLPPQKGLDSDA